MKENNVPTFAEHINENVDAEAAAEWEKQGYSVISCDSLFLKENPDVINAVGELIPWFVDGDKNVKKFWQSAHSFWNEDAILLRKKKDLFIAFRDSLKQIKITLTDVK